MKFAFALFASGILCGACVLLIAEGQQTNEVIPESKADPFQSVQNVQRSSESPTDGHRTSGRTSMRRREGEWYEGLGRFVFNGERVSFVPHEGPESFRVLENLALERVTRILEDPSGLGQKRLWRVAGRMTEYRGMNYLLLERAVLTAPPIDNPHGKGQQ